MPEKNTAVAKRPVDVLKILLANESTQEQFHNALRENKDAFVASIIDIYSSDTNLQKCEPRLVIMECLKAATLKLPINKSLGFVYIIPYADKPQMQIGYKGYIQLAMRTGQYRVINADRVLEGIKAERDLLTGSIKFTGNPTSDKVFGYFAYFELMNGFSKAIYMTRDEVIKHAERYSKSFKSEKPDSIWKTSFEQMAIKTPLRLLLSHYGIMSTEMQRAVDTEEEIADEIAQNANKGEIIDVDPMTGEIIEKKADPIGDSAKKKLQAEKEKKCCGCGTTEGLSQDEHGNWFCEKCFTGKPKNQAPF